MPLRLLRPESDPIEASYGVSVLDGLVIFNMRKSIWLSGLLDDAILPGHINPARYRHIGE